MQMVMIDKAVIERAIDTLRLKYSDQIYDGVGSKQAAEFEDDVEALRELLVQPQSLPSGRTKIELTPEQKDGLTSRASYIPGLTKGTK